MARRSYATPDQYAEWLGVETPPAGADRALAEATIVVDEMLETAVYDVDEEGFPVDADQRAAVRDATCAQADYARQAGDPNNVGAAAAWSSVRIGSAALTRTGGGNASGSTGSGGRHSPTARTLLRQAGMLNAGPWTW